MREIGICREEIELKRKTRTITVNHQQYVWWYTFHDNMASVIISPVHDKTAAITIQFANKSFPFQSDDTPIAIGYFPEYITIEKDHEAECLKTLSPRMVNLILNHVSADSFKCRNHIVYDAFDFIADMGYTVTDMKTGIYW